MYKGKYAGRSYPIYLYIFSAKIDATSLVLNELIPYIVIE